jgi:hypothetical protein
MLVPARSLVTGVPGRVQHNFGEAPVANNRQNAAV